jgi:hypothetical protein
MGLLVANLHGQALDVNSLLFLKTCLDSRAGAAKEPDQLLRSTFGVGRDGPMSICRAQAVVGAVNPLMTMLA